MSVGSQPYAYLFITAEEGALLRWSVLRLDSFLDVSDAIGETPDSYDEKIKPINQIIQAAIDEMENRVERMEMVRELRPSAQRLGEAVSSMAIRARYAMGDLYLLRSDKPYTMETLNQEIADRCMDGTITGWLVGKKYYGHHLKSSRGRKLIA